MQFTGPTFASAPSALSATPRVILGRIAVTAITAAGTDDTDGADAIFSLPAYYYFDYSGPGSTFPRERDFNTQTPEERLRPA